MSKSTKGFINSKPSTKKSAIPFPLEGDYSRRGHLLAKSNFTSQFLFIGDNGNRKYLAVDNKGIKQYVSGLFPISDNLYSIDDGIWNYHMMLDASSAVIVRKGRKGRRS